MPLPFPLRQLIVPLAFASGLAAWQADAEVHFPLRITPDGRHLEDATGRPFLVNGDAAWSLMVELDAAQTELYLTNRRDLGIDTVLVNLIERGFGGPANQDGELPFVPEDDYTSPNEAYFAYADQVLDRAADLGMLVLLTPSYLGAACGSQGWCEQMLAQSVEDMGEYGRFVGARYAHMDNIIWVHGGDSGSISARDHVNAIAEGIREMAPSHLHTGHCSRNNSAVECYDEPWLDINTTYSACATSIDKVADDYDHVPILPFFYIEGQYEGNTNDMVCLTGQNVWSVLGGAFGHVFGNNPIWRFGPGWEDELLSPGSQAMDHLGRLFRSRAWVRFEPDQAGEVLVAGGGSEAVAARAADGETAMVYLPESGPVSVDLGQVSGTHARIWWFDPVTGAAELHGTFPTSGVIQLESPGLRVLVFDDDASNLPAPASQPYDFPARIPAIGPRWAVAAAALVGVTTLVAARRRTSRSSASAIAA